MSDRFSDGIPVNPYTYQEPVQQLSELVGRDDIIEEIEYYLEQAEHSQYYNLAISGERGVGKTSVINATKEIARGRDFLAVDIPVNQMNTDDELQFFKDLIEVILEAGVEQDQINQSLLTKFRDIISGVDANPEFSLGYSSTYVKLTSGDTSNSVSLPTREVVDDLENIFQDKVNVPGIAVIIDDIDLLGDSKQILRKLESIVSEIEGYFLIVSGEDLSETFPEDLTPISQTFTTLHLESFEEVGNTQKTLLQPLSEQLEEEFDESCVNDVHQISDGSPYEIQLIAHHMYRQYEHGEDSITLTSEVLDKVAESLDRLRKREHHKVASRIKQLTEDQLSLLVSLLEFPEVPKDWLIEYSLLDDLDELDSGELSSQKKIRSDTIDRLERRDLTIEEEGNLDFAGGAFDRLYLKYYAASEGVIEDLRSYTTGFGEKPVNIIHFKIMDIAFDDFPEDYRCIAKFDMEYYPDSPGEFSKYWGMVIHRSGEITVESDEWTTILSFRIGEFQEKTPDSIWFRCNIDWMSHGFVAKVQVIDDSDERDYDELLRQNVEGLKQDLRHLDYEILLENEYTWFQKGRDAFNDGDFEQAVEYIDEAIAVNPLFYEGWQSRGLTLQNLNRDDEALFSFEMALGIGGENKEIMRKKGRILANKGLWGKAIECFEDLVEQNPEYQVGWLDLSRTYLQTGQFEESADAFKQYQRERSTSIET